MSKYIIKNCPATGAGCCGDTCPEITDCPLKQIVEKCKKEIRQNFLTERKLFANELLEKLDIQEILE